MIQLEEGKKVMWKRVSFVCFVFLLTSLIVAGLSADRNLNVQSAYAHNVCSLAMAVEVPCTYSVPPRPNEPATSRRWYTGTEHTPGYHDRVWYDYSPACTQGACILPGPFGMCAGYAQVPAYRTFPGPNDIDGPTSPKKRLYCGKGTASPVPHLHYIEPEGS